MARINIEEKLFADVRFDALVRRIGNKDQAIGMVVRAFILGQKHWGNGRELVPFDEWELADLDLLLSVHLAEKHEEGIYIRGSETYFEWYAKKVEFAHKGGSANAKRWKDKKEPIGYPIAKPIGMAIAEPSLDSPLSLALAPVLSSKELFISETADAVPEIKKVAKVKKPKEPSKGAPVWEAYAKAFQDVYKVQPMRNAKENSLCLKIVDSIGIDKAIAVVDFYVRRKDKSLIDYKHSLNYLLRHIGKFATEFETEKQGIFNDPTIKFFKK